MIKIPSAFHTATGQSNQEVAITMAAADIIVTLVQRNGKWTLRTQDLAYMNTTQAISTLPKAEGYIDESKPIEVTTEQASAIAALFVGEFEDSPSVNRDMYAIIGTVLDHLPIHLRPIP